MTQRMVWLALTVPALVGIAWAVLLMVRGSLVGREDPEMEHMSDEWARSARYETGKSQDPH